MLPRLTLLKVAVAALFPKTVALMGAGTLSAGAVRALSPSGLVLEAAALPAEAQVATRSWDYLATSVRVGECDVPCAVWAPAGSMDLGACSQTYEHRIDVGRIAQRLLRTSILSWLPAKKCSMQVGTAHGVAANGCAVLFAHGFLGSRFDELEACEALANRGFVVVAPEMPESLAASYEPRQGVDRLAICSAVRKKLDAALSFRKQRGPATFRKWGIFGQSAGAGTATTHPEAFACGRAALCGFRGYDGRDPLLVVASGGDGVIRLEYVAAVLANDAKQGRPTLQFDEAEAATAAYSAVRTAPARGALFFAEAGAGLPLHVTRADRSLSPAPSHISFLAEQTNDAMVSLLAPLLPVARLLGVPVLDFDVYQKNRDSRQTQAKLIPLLTAFFDANSRV